MKKSKVSRLSKKDNSANTTPRKRRASEEDFSISTDLKKQLLGFLIFTFGLLLGLAIISYSEKDQSTLERLSMIDIFRKEAYSAVYVTFNWLGIAGAYVSNFFINSFFGYFSIIISVILFAFGISLLRKKPLGRTIQFSIYSIMVMLCLASSFGLLKIFAGKENISSKLSGTTGDFFASVFYQTLGSAGASIFFAVALIVFSLLLLDGNLIKTLARFKLFIEKIKENFHREKEVLVTGKDPKEAEKTGRKNSMKEELSPEDREVEEALKKER